MSDVVDKERISYFAERITEILLENPKLENLFDPLYKVSQIDEKIILIRFPSSDDKLSGFSTVIDGYKCVYINSAHTLGRQNYSFWHEYYHSINDMREEMCVNYDDYDTIEEKEANYFASCMLLPKQKIKDYIICKNKPIQRLCLEDLILMQYEFRVSLQLLIFRMDELYDDGYFKRFLKFSSVPMREEYEKHVLSLGLELDLISPTNDFCIPNRYFMDMHSNLKSNKIGVEKTKEIMDFIDEKGVVCRW